jgi:hypothetical protein
MKIIAGLVVMAIEHAMTMGRRMKQRLMSDCILCRKSGLGKGRLG